MTFAESPLVMLIHHPIVDKELLKGGELTLDVRNSDELLRHRILRGGIGDLVSNLKVNSVRGIDLRAELLARHAFVERLFVHFGSALLHRNVVHGGFVAFVEYVRTVIARYRSVVIEPFVR